MTCTEFYNWIKLKFDDAECCCDLDFTIIKEKIKEVNPNILFNLSSSPNRLEWQGCSSQGFCYNCKIIYYGSPCFCGGTTCYKCGKYVWGRSEVPKDLTGIYEYRSWTKSLQKEYKDGKYVRTISETQLVDNNYKPIPKELQVTVPYEENK